MTGQECVKIPITDTVLKHFSTSFKAKDHLGEALLLFWNSTVLNIFLLNLVCFSQNPVSSRLLFHSNVSAYSSRINVALHGSAVRPLNSLKLVRKIPLKSFNKVMFQLASLQLRLYDAQGILRQQVALNKLY